MSDDESFEVDEAAIIECMHGIAKAVCGEAGITGLIAIAAMHTSMISLMLERIRAEGGDVDEDSKMITQACSLGTDIAHMLQRKGQSPLSTVMHETARTMSTPA